MAETETPSLEDRVAYLEAQNEGLKRAGLLALVLLLLLGFLCVHLTWADLKGVTTTGVVFQDDKQAFRGALMTTPSGHLGLVPVGLAGSLPQLQPYNNLDFQGLGIYDSQGRVRILLGTNSTDQPVMAIFGENSEPIWSPMPAGKPAARAPGAPEKPPTPGAPGTAPGTPSMPAPPAAPGTPSTPASPAAPATPATPATP